MLLPLVGFAVLGVAAVLALVLMLWKPRESLAMGTMIVLLASTKFRNRSSADLLSGSLDGQIFFELGLYALLAMIALRGLLLLPPRSLRISPLGALLGGYVGIALMSGLWSPNTAITVVRATQLTILFAYGYVAVSVLGSRRMLQLVGASLVLYVLVCASLAVVFPFADGTRALWSGHPRFSWFAVHPIGAGIFSATAALFLLAQTLFSRDRTAWWSLGLPVWIYLAPLVAILLATRSRGPLFAFAFAALLLLVRKYAIGHRAVRTSSTILVGLLAALMAAALPVVGLGGSIGDSLASFLMRGQTADQFVSGTGRMSLWQSALSLALERPIFGSGFLASREILLREIRWGGHTHNGFLESLLGLGAVGALLLWIPVLVLLALSFLHLLRTSPHLAYGPAVVFGVLVFQTLSSVTDPGFAGPPGPDALLVFVFGFAYGGIVAERARLIERPPTVVRAPSELIGSAA